MCCNVHLVSPCVIQSHRVSSCVTVFHLVSTWVPLRVQPLSYLLIYACSLSDVLILCTRSKQSQNIFKAMLIGQLHEVARVRVIVVQIRCNVSTVYIHFQYTSDTVRVHFRYSLYARSTLWVQFEYTFWKTVWKLYDFMRMILCWYCFG